MARLPYRAVIVDLDRTLLRTDKSISRYTEQVLREWETAGAGIYVATARPEQAIYFGDDNDDIEPIRMCGRGVAVSNALAHIRQAADDIADSNDNDGVAKYLAGLMG